MKGSTHLMGGLCAGAAIALYMRADITHTAIGIGVAGLASLVPDWINPSIPGLRLDGATGHRGFTHWLATALISSVVIALVMPAYNVHWLVGYLSHIALDTMTRRGVPALWPFKAQISLLPIKEGGLFDKVICSVLFVVLAVIIARSFMNR